MKNKLKRAILQARQVVNETDEVFPFSIWACSDSSDVNELVAYASIMEPTPFPKQVEAIGIFISGLDS